MNLYKNYGEGDDIEYLLYSKDFDNALSKISEVFYSKELSSLRYSSQRTIILNLLDKVQEAMTFVDIFKEINIENDDVEDSELKEEKIDSKINELISKLNDVCNDNEEIFEDIYFINDILKGKLSSI